MIIGAAWLGLSNGNDPASAQSDDEIADRVQRLIDSLEDEVSKWGPPTSTLKSSSTPPRDEGNNRTEGAAPTAVFSLGAEPSLSHRSAFMGPPQF